MSAAVPAEAPDDAVHTDGSGPPTTPQRQRFVLVLVELYQTWDEERRCKPSADRE